MNVKNKVNRKIFRFNKKEIKRCPYHGIDIKICGCYF